jgi:hypothetical protein
VYKSARVRIQQQPSTRTIHSAGNETDTLELGTNFTFRDLSGLAAAAEKSVDRFRDFGDAKLLLLPFMNVEQDSLDYDQLYIARPLDSVLNVEGF